MDIDVQEQNIASISLDLLKTLLRDKTTQKYIRWCTDNYQAYGNGYYADQEIKPELITGERRFLIRPRVLKEIQQQLERTRDKAEVFTPSWICNEQNNLVDEAWFGRQHVFNIPKGTCWLTRENPVIFPKEKTWQEYVDARRMEVTCGEAPYLISRYDTVTGEYIPLEKRIGLLDRKMRVVNENTVSKREWEKWAIRACQSCYGYDFQGDNVLLARENFLYSFIDYYQARFHKQPALENLTEVAEIAAWNIWQMNGLTLTAPYSVLVRYYQPSLFDLEEEGPAETEEMPCKIYDWLAKTCLEFRSLAKRR